MSEWKEILESKVTVYLKPKESVLVSVSRDIVTFGFLLLCIYVSQGSAWWTFLTGSMFLLAVASKINSTIKENTETFDTKEAAKAYLDNHPDLIPKGE